jgi:hypothetical protein
MQTISGVKKHRNAVSLLMIRRRSVPLEEILEHAAKSKLITTLLLYWDLFENKIEVESDFWSELLLQLA